MRGGGCADACREGFVDLDDSHASELPDFPSDGFWTVSTA